MLTLELLASLPPKSRRGSRPRCLLLTNGPAAEVAGRLSDLVAPYAGVDPARDTWMPRGFDTPGEVRLGKGRGFLTDGQVDVLASWWLENRRANKPTWDIAYRAAIAGASRLVMVEAKAHVNELGKHDRMKGTHAGNLRRIGAAIAEANGALNTIVPGWSLACDTHYQLSNRFAWAWKIASLGVPVILIYLGFLHANEMADKGEPFADHEAWVRTVKAYAHGFVPESVWDNCLMVNDTLMWTLIRSVEVKLK